MLKYQVTIMFKGGTLRIRHERHGVAHSINSPAFLSFIGYIAWIQYGKYHRKDWAAIIHANGIEEKWIRGKYVEK
jgi:hypothetical protein